MELTLSDIEAHLTRIKPRADELAEQLADPNIYADQKRCRKLHHEQQEILKLTENFQTLQKISQEIEANKLLLEEESDLEMRGLIESDLNTLAEKEKTLFNAALQQLLPPDPYADRDIIVEIKPAAGGDEAALFAGELYRAYSRYAELQHWKQDLLELSASDLGGIKEVIFSLSGEGVYQRMKFESGVHRVQRVPVTETSGRVHTSTITVSVLPEAEDVDLEINPEDLRFDTFRASGAGGQHVNRTDSAVRVTHIPTGMSVASQSERSQHRNKEICMRILRSRMLEQKQRDEDARLSSAKRAQVGTGDRSERIRTYNFPQSRITDHRYAVSFFDLPGLLEGNFVILHDQIIAADLQQRLENLTMPS